MVQLRPSSQGSTAAPFSKRRGSWRRLVTSIAGAALLASGFVAAGDFGAAPAAAAPGDPFDPSVPTVFIAQGSGTQLQRAETAGDGTFQFTDEGPRAPVSYNAIGFNPEDNYLYGMVTTGNSTYPTGSLVQIGEGGRITRIGNQIYRHPDPAGTDTRFYSGAFNPADHLYYISDSSPNTTMLAIDVSTGNVERTIDLGEAPRVQDFAFRDGYAWGGTADGDLKRLDVTNGNIVVFEGALPPGPGGYGAAWNFGNGNLGFSANSTGNVVQLEIVDGETADPTFRIVSQVPGPSSSLNDGASIPGLPADLTIAKSAPATFTSGEPLAYEITVTNNGDGVSSGWTVTDTLPAGLSNPQVAGDGSATIDGDTITLSGGRLEVGDSATFTITADTDVPVGECVDNTAIVTGNEADDNPDNNSSTAESCSVAPALTLTKSSEGTENSRPGDDVTYTITATNTGSADYTDENPAVIFDDLSGVLDDATFNDDAEASQDGELSYEEPLLSWTGALAVDESVEISYTATLQSGGDGEVRNVAWQPEDPEDSAPPACDPADDNGMDPETGEPCAVVEYDLPKLTIDKVADRFDLPAVDEEVTYTITVTNVGPGDYTDAAPATMTDDLTDVIDDATFVEDSLESTVGEPLYEEPTLSWSGALASGESAEITYAVAYTGEGDQQLVNAACVPEEDLAAGARACDKVTVPGSGLKQWKTVEASDDPVVAGTELTYTLHFENDGKADATVDAVDDLTHVLDDADVSVEPEASVEAWEVSRADEVISISGDLAAGETETVSYTVTVLPDGERGDDIAANFLLGPDEEPPADPVCEPSDPDQPECTTTPIGGIEYAKAVTADDNPVVTGTELTYEITITSTGEATMPVDREDVLTDVLDDATIVSQPTSDTDSVTVSEIADDRFSIGGELAGGETATVSYSVVVKEESERGNDSADNFLVPTGEDPPSECVEGDASCTVTPLPNVDVAKSVDPESGSTVVAGQELTYTLTFTNSGNAAGPVEFTDVLTDVLDDADVTAEPVASSDDLTVSEVADGAFTVTGSLGAGQSETVAYTVTVKADGDRGDNVLGNFVVPTGTTPPDECDADSGYCTEHPVPQIDAWKSVEANESPVAAGTELSYTLHFENSGAATGTVDMVDDLTHVLDDADMTSEPDGSVEAWEVSRAEEVISINGDLAAGETATVTYTVTVLPDGERGDDVLANYLLAPGEEPPSDPVCEPTDEEQPNCTANPVGDILPAKTVNPESGSTVEEGQELTYTLSFENTGQGAATVDFVDHMADVLDDAELAGEISTTGGAQVAGPIDGQLLVSGTVQPGETATVVYTVTVKPYDDQGDHHLGNFLTEGDQEPPTECVEGNPLCTQNLIDPPPPTGTPSLPGTGAQVAIGTLAAAFLATALGMALVRNSRRRTE